MELQAGFHMEGKEVHLVAFSWQYMTCALMYYTFPHIKRAEICFSKWSWKCQINDFIGAF
jgi:hypothetical protein